LGSEAAGPNTKLLKDLYMELYNEMKAASEGVVLTRQNLDRSLARKTVYGFKFLDLAQKGRDDEQ